MAATKATLFRIQQAILTLAIFCAASSAIHAAVLPEERADAMYHRYDGGGMEIDGPSILVRKNIGEHVSISANHYVDTVSSASIDVETTGASPYLEERTEQSYDITFLRNKSLVTIGRTTSTENDYDAESLRLDISQDFFGDMTTVSLGYSQAEDDITKNFDPDFGQRSLERRHYRFGLAQVLSKNLLLNLNYESILDEGFLNNPYRAIRLSDGSSQAEVYPRTRNSDAASLKFAYHLPWKGAIKTHASYFEDSWKINGKSYGVEYSHQLERWIVDLRYRVYEQGEASFYSDVFDINNTQNFRGRDKELSQFSNTSIGAGLSYQWPFRRFIEKLQFAAQVDYMEFEYDNFRDARVSGVEVGTEPLYAFDAYALRVMLSIWY